MKVDIWSDIRCPFCYIGKRRFEQALEKFGNKDKVEVCWRSFQLDPELKHRPGKTIYEYLAERKGMSVEESKQMHRHMEGVAKEVGLSYNFDKTIVAGSFDAERLIQFAKTKGLGDIAEERMFKAYFTEGKNIADHSTLIEVGAEMGLDKAKTEKMLKSDAFVKEVNSDIARANEVGVRGVPFFVFNNKYAVSGAQPSEVFLNALEQSWSEFEKTNPGFNIQSKDENSCSIDGDC